VLNSSRTSGYQCTDCPKLYPITPTASPTTSPVPGKKRSRVPLLTNAQVVRQRAEARRRNRAAAKRAGTLKEDGIRIRGRWISTGTLIYLRKTAPFLIIFQQHDAKRSRAPQRTVQPVSTARTSLTSPILALVPSRCFQTRSLMVLTTQTWTLSPTK